MYMHTCPAKCIPARKLPHTCKQLGQPTTEDGHADYDIAPLEPASPDIVHREDEQCGGKREETKGTRVGNACGARRNWIIWRRVGLGSNVRAGGRPIFNVGHGRLTKDRILWEASECMFLRVPGILVLLVSSSVA